jgi:FlaG/FlaF family flagellin (archaellin)
VLLDEKPLSDFITMLLRKFHSNDKALSSVTVVALLILATLLISVVLALFILGMGG